MNSSNDHHSRVNVSCFFNTLAFVAKGNICSTLKHLTQEAAWAASRKQTSRVKVLVCTKLETVVMLGLE